MKLSLYHPLGDFHKVFSIVSLEIYFHVYANRELYCFQVTITLVSNLKKQTKYLSLISELNSNFNGF